jgi:hypothetical protein
MHSHALLFSDFLDLALFLPCSSLIAHYTNPLLYSQIKLEGMVVGVVMRLQEN